jgi:3-methyladenine DNA glycosylase AlkD
MPKAPASPLLPTLRDLRRELEKGNDPARAAFYKRFFKCGPGQYGEGDTFRGGFTVPQIRVLARAYRHLSFEDAAALLDSPWHEDRQLALIHLVSLYERGAPPLREKIHRLYLRHVGSGVNNWDLVDGSAPQLVGAHLEAMRAGGDPAAPLRMLEKMARDKNLWKRRVAVVATLHFIRRGSYGEVLRLSEILLNDREDLMHKATGWMLREMGKREVAPLVSFLDRYAAVMPRTMLRYALEKFPEDTRKKYRAAGKPPRA